MTEDGKKVHLALRSSQGEARVLTLLGVSNLHVEDFWQGNILANLWCGHLTGRRAFHGFERSCRRSFISISKSSPRMPSCSTSTLRTARTSPPCVEALSSP